MVRWPLQTISAIEVSHLQKWQSNNSTMRHLVIIVHAPHHLCDEESL